MKYSTREMRASDIDWFFLTLEDIPIHVASAAGILPNFIDKVNNRDVLELLGRTSNEFYNQLLDKNFFQDTTVRQFLLDNIRINELALERVENEQKAFYKENRVLPLEWKENYLISFCVMAKCGFLSFDRMDIANVYSNHYQWIADGSHNVLDESITQKIPRIDVSVEDLKNTNADWLDILNRL